MKIAFLIAILFLLRSISASATEVSSAISQPPLQTSDAVILTTGEELDAEAPLKYYVLKYKQAEEIRIKLNKELVTIYELRQDEAAIKQSASQLIDSFLNAKKAAKNRREALAGLSEMEQAGRTRSEASILANSVYRSSANKALKAIAAYAVAEGESAADFARSADAATDKKAEARKAADKALSEALDVAQTFRSVLSRIKQSDSDVKSNLAEVTLQGAKINLLCQNLIEKARKEDPQIAAVAKKHLSPVIAKIGNIMNQASRDAAIDMAEFKSLPISLKNIDDHGGIATDTIESAFETTINDVVEMEAYSYEAAMSRSGEDENIFQADLQLSRLTIEKEKAVIGKIEKALAEENNFISSIIRRQVLTSRHLSKRFERLSSVTARNSSIPSYLSALEKELQTLTEVKNKELVIAVKAEDEAYFNAYGKERFYESITAPQADVVTRKLPDRYAMRMEVKAHVYSYVNAIQGEPKNYGSYTYVLFAQRYQKAQDHVKKRYTALLEAIIRSTPSDSEFSGATAKEYLNIFCIPFKRHGVKKGESEAYKDYDSGLAFSILATAANGAILRNDIISTIRTSPGPFLLTTRSRLSDGSSKTQLLFVDLSGYSPDAFDSILAAYKNRLIQYPPSGQEIYYPPVTQRLIYASVSAADAIPELMDRIKNIYEFFTPSAHASPREK